jgi:hypothetical protein
MHTSPTLASISLRLLLPLAATTLGLLACAPSQTAERSSDQDPGQPPTDEPDPAPACGGFAGTPCPDGLTCVDDPSDSCDPNQGGADCMGVCIGGVEPECEAAPGSGKRYVGHSPDMCARMKFACNQGEEFFADECGCGCVTSS